MVKTMKMVGKMIDETMKGETEWHRKAMKMVPKRSLVTKTYERYQEKGIPQRLQEHVTLGSFRKTARNVNEKGRDDGQSHRERIN